MILVAGEALIDLVISPGGEVSAALGGAPFNTARACSRLGGDVAFVGAISIDRFGRMLATQLADDGVDLDHAARVDLPTTLAAAELDEEGAATYRFYVEGTSAPALDRLPGLRSGPTPEFVFTGGLGLVLEPMASVIEQLIEVRSETTVVMIDVNCRPLLVDDRASYVRRVFSMTAAATVVKVSTDDLAYLVPDSNALDAARSLLTAGATVVLLTDGSGDVRILTGDDERSVPVPPVGVVDTIGAGDTFGGAALAWFAANRCSRQDLASIDVVLPAVEFAVKAASIACQRAGADPPWAHEL